MFRSWKTAALFTGLAASFTYFSYRSYTKTQSFLAKIVPLQIPTKKQIDETFKLEEKSVFAYKAQPSGIYVSFDKEKLSLTGFRKIVSHLKESEDHSSIMENEVDYCLVIIKPEFNKSQFNKKYADLSYVSELGREYLKNLGDKILCIAPNGYVALCFNSEKHEQATTLQKQLEEKGIASTVKKVPISEYRTPSLSPRDKIFVNSLSQQLSKRSPFFMPMSLDEATKDFPSPLTTKIPYTLLSIDNLIGFCQLVNELYAAKNNEVKKLSR